MSADGHGAARGKDGSGWLVGGAIVIIGAVHGHCCKRLVFGGFYPSRVKKYPVTTSFDIVAQSRAEIALPRVVIGGMTQENAAPLVAGGADMVAVISSIYMADDPQAAARGFVGLFGLD